MNTGTAWVSLGTGAYETVRVHQAGSWLLGRVRRGKPPRDDVVRRRAFFRLLIVLVSVAMIGSGLMRLVTPHRVYFAKGAQTLTTPAGAAP